MSALQQAADVIRRGKRFLLTCHVLPDSDAIGSMLGLAEVLRALGKDVHLYNRDPVPDNIAFLPGAGRVMQSIPTGVTFDGTLITDTAARSLLPRTFPPREVTGPLIIVDHHVAHDDFGDIVVRDVNACATAMVVLQLAATLGVKPVPQAAAAPLYAAIIADTGGFRYPGTTSETLRTAADLLDLGVAPWELASHVFEQWPMARLRLLGMAINSMETEFAGRVAVLIVPLSMIDKAGATDQMVEGMVEYGRMLKDVECAVMLWERRPRSDETLAGPSLTRLSLRSAGRVDVSRIATSLGGGGHRAAAGATLSTDLRTAREHVMRAVERELGFGDAP